MEPTATHSKSSLQLTLAHSYLVYFIFSILGLFADTFFSIESPLKYGQWIALACFTIGPLIIGWAQATSAAKSTVPYFLRGPYRFVRNPTQIGILILVSGYTAVSGSVLFLLATLVSYLLSNKFFNTYEAILHKQYDGEYADYKKSVPKVF